MHALKWESLEIIIKSIYCKGKCFLTYCWALGTTRSWTSRHASFMWSVNFSRPMPQTCSHAFGLWGYSCYPFSHRPQVSMFTKLKYIEMSYKNIPSMTHESSFNRYQALQAMKVVYKTSPALCWLEPLPAWTVLCHQVPHPLQSATSIPRFYWLFVLVLAIHTFSRLPLLSERVDDGHSVQEST